MNTINRTAPLQIGAVGNKDEFWEIAVRLSEQRLNLIASNIANGDTPNYKARDLDFRAAFNLALATSEGSPLPKPLRRGTQVSNSSMANSQYRVPTQGSVDGNTVDMDQERAAFAEQAIQYEMFLQSALEEYKEMSTLFKNMQG